MLALKCQNLAWSHPDKQGYMVDNALAQIQRVDMLFSLVSVHGTPSCNLRLFRGVETAGRVTLDIAFRHLECVRALWVFRGDRSNAAEKALVSAAKPKSRL